MRLIRWCALGMVAGLASGCLDTAAPSAPYDLVLMGGESMVESYGGLPVAAAVLNTSTGVVAERRTGTVATSGSVGWEFTFPDLLDLSTDYLLLWWVDANEDGGETGACDPPEIDPQWRIEIPQARADITVSSHVGLLQRQPACQAFTVDLSIVAGTEFQTHGGADFLIRVVDDETGADALQVVGQLSDTNDPPLAAAWDDLLVVGRSYHMDVWIDANVDGGNVGVCDPPANDPQWRIDLGTIGESDVDVELELDAEMTEICAST